MSDGTTHLMLDILSNNLFVAVVSGLLGILVSTFFYWQYETRKEKKEAARALLANRFDLKGDDFSRALNQASVIFHEHKDVIGHLTALHDQVRNGTAKDETLVGLFRAVCAAARIDVKQINDEFLLNPFNTRHQ